jgi:hypothetical protein
MLLDSLPACNRLSRHRKLPRWVLAAAWLIRRMESRFAVHKLIAELLDGASFATCRELLGWRKPQQELRRLVEMDYEF